MTKTKTMKVTKKLYRHGMGFGVHIDVSIADAIGVGVGDYVETTIRRATPAEGMELTKVTFTKRLYQHGGGFAVHIDVNTADALGVGMDDLIEVTIRRAT